MNDERVVVWGVGYIGFSNMLYYANAGCRVLGIDIDKDKWNNIRSGKALLELRDWLPFEYEDLLHSDKMSFASDSNQFEYKDILGHLICVPTEKENEPWEEAIYDVLDKIIILHNEHEEDDLTIIVESTLIPGMAERLINYTEKKMSHGKLYFGVAPRRDWFVIDGGNLGNLPRIFGCNSKEASKYIKKILSIVCSKLIEADDYRQAEMTKSVENSIRHVGITLANQLADAFPEIDIIRVLELAATKWNVQLYYPSFGIGGYCIPLSSKYLLQADRKDEIRILEETVKYNEQRANNLSNIILDNNVKKIGILGLCYIGNVKVVKNSIIIDLAYEFIRKGKSVKINEPLYKKDEVFQLTNCETFELKSREKFDCLILFAGHSIYDEMAYGDIENLLKTGGTIWDNTGLWEKYSVAFQDNGISYRRVGMKGWK